MPRSKIAAPFAAHVSPSTMRTTTSTSALEKEQEKVEREKKRLNSGVSDIVEINIGGQSIIQVHHETLCLFPDSKFSRIFSGNSDDDSTFLANHSNWKNNFVSRDSEGRIFFDYDPSLIESIINYLRLKRIHMLVSSSSSSNNTTESILPPMSPPKPPEGKKEEFDILLHCFGLTRFFYPKEEDSSIASSVFGLNYRIKEKFRKQKAATHRNKIPQAPIADERKMAASEGELLSRDVPNFISVSEYKKIEEYWDPGTTSIEDDCGDDDDDDAKTCPLSLDSNDNTTELKEVQEKVAGTKRAHQFEENCNAKNKKMQKSTCTETVLSRKNSKVSPSTSIARNRQQRAKEEDSQPNQTTKKGNQTAAALHSALERLHKKNPTQTIPVDVPWKFLPGKPVDENVTYFESGTSFLERDILTKQSQGESLLCGTKSPSKPASPRKTCQEGSYSLKKAPRQVTQNSDSNSDHNFLVIESPSKHFSTRNTRRKKSDLLKEGSKKKTQNTTLSNDLCDSDSDHDFLVTESPSKPSSRRSTRRVESDELKKGRRKKTQNTILSSDSCDSDSDHGFLVSEVAVKKNKTPLKDLQKILSRLKSKSQRKSPAKRKSL